jgi:hypothetical protein
MWPNLVPQELSQKKTINEKPWKLSVVHLVGLVIGLKDKSPGANKVLNLKSLLVLRKISLKLKKVVIISMMFLKRTNNLIRTYTMLYQAKRKQKRYNQLILTD